MFFSNHKWINAVAGAAVAIACLSFTDRYFNLSKQLDIFTACYRDINMYYVDDAEPSKLMRTGIDAMLKTLDPFTNYISESQIETYRMQHSEKLVGIGAQVEIMDSVPVITDVTPKLPAAKAGLQPGDKITAIDGKPTFGRSNDEIGLALRGQAGSAVTVSVTTISGENKTVNLSREETQETNVPFFGMLDSHVGCINLKIFNPDAGKDVKNAFDSLKRMDPEMKGLILDLRGNPGGLLQEAVNIVNLFIEKNKLVVTTKGRVPEWNSTFKTQADPADTRIPIAILTDSKSASASEIVSGALQDYDRAVVMGQKTYGKGLVQVTKNLSYNTMLKVTTARYYIPSGRCIQALLYAERNEDGSVKRVPDSLKKEFKTTNGRRVWDGGGVDPDLPVPHPDAPAVVKALQEKHLIFDFATRYKLQHPAIPQAAKFQLTDADFADFVAFVRGKNFTYQTESDAVLKKLETDAKDEKYFEAVKSAFLETQARLETGKKEALEKSKAAMLPILEAEITGRYYAAHGKIEKQLQSDPLARRAVELLNTPGEYNDLLAKKN